MRPWPGRTGDLGRLLEAQGKKKERIINTERENAIRDDTDERVIQRSPQQFSVLRTGIVIGSVAEGMHGNGRRRTSSLLFVLGDGGGSRINFHRNSSGGGGGC